MLLFSVTSLRSRAIRDLPLTPSVSPWLSPVLERLAAKPLVGFGVGLALLPLLALAVYALYRLGMQLARVRLVPVVVRGGRA